MRVVKPTRVKAWGITYPDAAESLLKWLKAAETAEWCDIQELRQAYPHADAVTVASGAIVTVINIRGNRYRLIVSIKYRWGILYVLRFLTHAEYDKDKWKAEL